MGLTAVGLTAVGWGRVTRLTPKPLCLLGVASPPAQGITHVDMMSIDTENSEVAVLQGLDFSAVTVDVFVIEDAYASGVRNGTPGSRPRIPLLFLLIRRSHSISFTRAQGVRL